MGVGGESARAQADALVSMKSGLEGRNNTSTRPERHAQVDRLNEVRPRRPEQCTRENTGEGRASVSMKSGLEGRNNVVFHRPTVTRNERSQ